MSFALGRHRPQCYWQNFAASMDVEHPMAVTEGKRDVGARKAQKREWQDVQPRLQKKRHMWRF